MKIVANVFNANSGRIVGNGGPPVAAVIPMQNAAVNGERLPEVAPNETVTAEPIAQNNGWKGSLTTNFVPELGAIAERQAQMHVRQRVIHLRSRRPEQPSPTHPQVRQQRGSTVEVEEQELARPSRQAERAPLELSRERSERCRPQAVPGDLRLRDAPAGLPVAALSRMVGDERVARLASELEREGLVESADGRTGLPR